MTGDCRVTPGQMFFTQVQPDSEMQYVPSRTELVKMMGKWCHKIQTTMLQRRPEDAEIIQKWVESALQIGCKLSSQFKKSK